MTTTLASVTDAHPLIPDQRREVLLRELRAHDVLSVAQLTELLGVSHMTVRRDIASLEEAGRLVSVPGGARIASQVSREPTFEEKSVTERKQKLAMAKTVADRVRDNTAVYLDAGTTTRELIPYLRQLEGVTLVTNDFPIATEAMETGNLDIIHVGGRVDIVNRSSVGSLAASTLSQIAIDVAFISTPVWDLSHGVTIPSEAKVAVKKAAIAAARTSILMASSSKYGTFGMYRIAALSDFDAVVTDWGLDPQEANELRDSGVELIEARESDV